MIEVGLIFGSELRLAGASDFNAKAGGKTIGKYKTGSVVVLTRKGSNVYVNGKKAGREVLFVPARNVPGFLVKGNKYRGDMKAIPSSWGNGITLINVLPMEDYLKGVVPSEIVPSWRMDAIKAQAVAARTYATYHRNGYRSSGYDVTDDTRTQVYRGFQRKQQLQTAQFPKRPVKLSPMQESRSMHFSIQAAAALPKTAKMYGDPSFLT